MTDDKFTNDSKQTDVDRDEQRQADLERKYLEQLQRMQCSGGG